MASYFCKPCEYLGKCIDKGCECGCKACGAMCSAPCEAFAACCCPVDRPSPIFLTYSVVICGIPAVFAIIGATSGATGCENAIVPVLGCMLAINVALIGFAIYLYLQFTKPYQGADEQGRAETGVMSRASNMFCYDPVVFFYLCTIGAGAVLSILLATWSGAKGCETQEAASTLKRAMSSVIALFWVYVFGGIFVVSLSLCVECGRTKGVTQAMHTAHGHGGSFSSMSSGGFVQRLFFPRANIHTPVARPAPYTNPNAFSNVPQAIPADGPTTYVPPQHNNSFGQPPPSQAPHAQPPPQQNAASSAQKAAGFAAQGLRMGAQMLQKASQK